MGICSMSMIKDGEISCSETNADMFLWKVNFSSAKNWGSDLIYFFSGTFALAPRKFFQHCLAYLSFNTRLSPYSFEIFGLFALTTPVAILMTWHLLITLPDILVPIAVPLAFFSIPESNRLSLPILLTTVQSPSSHFFFQLLTGILTKEYFRYLVVNFLIVQAVSNPLAYSPTSFLIFAGISTWYFFGLLYIFWISSLA